ncbi:DUF6378 domain-containing protein [Rhodococcus ruber]|uniref:DUF6378 domain-containing protein n=1 Tax=Rhodococcus ruber TaxID=1830 RepID=A0A098BJY2_9NOCA|nr:DUF6378 domain-containing protein [Rhodococcus ruber]MCZ4533342.1 DUF6378 domain-containing protein [Rhodococcus ruber]MCZ4533407.1 DUF6378 domain-containing protein [Rhodococcus ruber]CDZ89003.1 hypothetical protein RHRU231_450170 [Rhodococcus ruber]
MDDTSEVKLSSSIARVHELSRAITRLEQELSAKERTVSEQKSASILDEAASIVAGSRATEYGEGAENSLPRIAAYWSTYLGRELSARDAANMMVLLKMARESHKPKRDNHTDAIGYMLLAEQCEDKL